MKSIKIIFFVLAIFLFSGCSEKHKLLDLNSENKLNNVERVKNGFNSKDMVVEYYDGKSIIKYIKFRNTMAYGHSVDMMYIFDKTSNLVGIKGKFNESKTTEEKIKIARKISKNVKSSTNMEINCKDHENKYYTYFTCESTQKDSIDVGFKMEWSSIHIQVRKNKKSGDEFFDIISCKQGHAELCHMSLKF